MSTGRAVSRRTALKALGTSAGAIAFLPWLSAEGQAAFAEIKAKSAAPSLRALTREQYATVEALVEAIIPKDERSPGAKEARVADYFDLLLSEALPEPKKEWFVGLTALDAEATQRFGAPFVRLTPAQVETLLTDISRFEVEKPKTSAPDAALDVSRQEQPKEKPVLVTGLLGDVRRLDPASARTPLERFFAATKRATVHGYYTSEIGIHQELRYKGNQILAEFVGCKTQDGQDCPHCGQKVQG
jgi:hypothetical protein